MYKHFPIMFMVFLIFIATGSNQTKTSNHRDTAGLSPEVISILLFD